MTDFLPYTTGEYAVDAPATALHFERWFRNWEAGFEGAPNATRLRIGALQRLNPGTEIRSRADTEVNLTGVTTYLAGHAFAFAQAGTIRVSLDHRASTNSGGPRVVRRRAGVDTVVASWTNTTTYQTRTADVAVLPGDHVRIEHQGLGAGVAVYLRNCRFQTAGADLFPGIECVLEGNTYNA